MVPLGEIAAIAQCKKPGSPHNPPSGDETPRLLQGHDCTRDNTMAGRDPEPLREPANGLRREYRPSVLHLSDTIRWNSQPTLASILPRPAVAGKGWTAGLTLPGTNGAWNPPFRAKRARAHRASTSWRP